MPGTHGCLERKRNSLRARRRGVGRNQEPDQLICNGECGAGRVESRQRLDAIGKHSLSREDREHRRERTAARTADCTVARGLPSRGSGVFVRATVHVMHGARRFLRTPHRTVLRRCWFVTLGRFVRHGSLVREATRSRHERRQRRGLEQDPRGRKKTNVPAYKCHL